MGRHESSFGKVDKYTALARGLYASTLIQTAFGWQTLSTLGPGDLVMTYEAGLVPITELSVEVRCALWSVRFPVGAIGNPEILMLPPGQPILIQTEYAMPFSGDDLALVPATALEGWHGIVPQVPAQTDIILQIKLASPGIVFAGPGFLAGVVGDANGAARGRRFTLQNAFKPPTRPVLPLAAARQMVAHLVAEEACEGLIDLQAAALR